MKRMSASLALTVLLLGAPNRGFALMGIDQVSRQAAKEMGIAVRFTANGPNEVWVELEFRPEGKLRDFQHVSLEIREGKTFLMGYAPLGEKRTRSGSVVVHFLANRAYLDKVTLSVVTGFPTNQTGHELRLRDFLEEGKSR